MEQVGSTSDYQPKSAAVGYLRLRFTQVQEDILSKMQEALRMLRAVYPLRFFSDSHIATNKYNEDKIGRTSNRMIALAATMLEECQYMLPSTKETMTTGEKILSVHDYVFSSVYENGISDGMLQQLTYVLSRKTSSIHYLFATATLLRLMCKVYVSCECKRYSKLLLEEFEQMQKLLKV